jgi:ELWxxDGT repeat protein
MKHVLPFLFLCIVSILSAQQVFMVKDLNSGASNGLKANDDQLRIHAGLDSVCILLASGKLGVKLLCSSNGTDVGTFAIMPPLAATDKLLYPTVSGNLFWFVIRDNSDHDKLYSTDGTWAGTQLRVNEQVAQVREMHAIAGGVVYSRDPDNFDNEDLIRLRLTGNNLTKTILASCYWFGGLLEFAVADSNTIWGIGSGAANGDRSIFKCTGAANSRTDIKVINTGSEFNYRIYMTPIGNKCYYFYHVDGEKHKLWVSDGTAAGTQALATLEDLVFEDLQADHAILAHQNKLYFRGKADGSSTGVELWVSDGTVAGTRQIKDIADGNSDSAPKRFTIHQNRFFFNAKTDTGNSKLWLLNAPGTDAAEAYSGFNWNEYYGVDALAFRDSVVFGGYKASLGGELMMGSVAANSSKAISDYSTANDDLFYPTNLTATKKLLFFQGTKASKGRELWAFDPTRATTGVFSAPVNAELLSASPNPASQVVNITRGGLQGACKIDVFTAAGVSVYSNQLDTTDSFTSISVSTWPTGTYQVVLRDAHGQVGIARVLVE